jgi:hypothetical protein
MNINKTVLVIRQNWIRNIGRAEAEYFIDPGTMKDMAIYRTLLHIRRRKFDSEFELALHLSRYLQILIVMASVSDDRRDEILIKNFLEVPFRCEEISRFNRLIPGMDLEEKQFLTIKKYPIPEFCEKSALETEAILKSTPTRLKPVVHNILSYDSTPIVAMALAEKDTLSTYSFTSGIQTLLEVIFDKHYSEDIERSERINDFIKGIHFIGSLGEYSKKKAS